MNARRPSASKQHEERAPPLVLPSRLDRWIQRDFDLCPEERRAEFDGFRQSICALVEMLPGTGRLREWRKFWLWAGVLRPIRFGGRSLLYSVRFEMEKQIAARALASGGWAHLPEVYCRQVIDAIKARFTLSLRRDRTLELPVDDSPE